MPTDDATLEAADATAEAAEASAPLPLPVAVGRPDGKLIGESFR